jgi:hypothetical protein
MTVTPAPLNGARPRRVLANWLWFSMGTGFTEAVILAVRG